MTSKNSDSVAQQTIAATPASAPPPRRSLKQRFRTLPRRCSLGMSAWLFVVWMLLIRDLSAVSIGGGVLIAVGLQIFFPMPHVNPVKRFRPLQVVWLVLRFGWDLLASALQVAYVVLRQKPARPQIIEVEMITRSEFYLTMASAMTCLVPGSLVVRARINPSRVTLHVLDRELSKGARGVEKSLHALEMRIVKALGSKAEIQEAQERLQRYEQLVAEGKIPYSAQSPYVIDEGAHPRPESERH
ncbi:Na+/H+ antiporter subunit E [Varibaculum cambriense]|uniref:Na+/H+ antiporter subunit E n=1 Tax=Varibaculum cambriense TaxID=184870 RepID=UPI00241CE7C1|nr:Na+/H+ antiporter subunit E [Varibaculum cambriense]MBS5943903.1 Na+/H+ antiporter subunit E [Varibaculum cambriense]